MFHKIDVSMFENYMTKYPNGKTIFESLSGVLTSFNTYVDEINGKFGTLPEQMKALFDSSVLTLDQLQVLEEYYAAQALLLETNYLPRILGVESQLAEKTNKTVNKRKAFITITDDDAKSEFISNGHSAKIALHPNAKISLAINPNLIGTAGYLTWAEIEAYNANSQYEILNHGWNHSEPLTLSLATIQANYALEKAKFIEHGLSNYDYYVYPGYTPPPANPSQVSNADLKNRLRQVYKCCLANTDAKNSYIPFDAYEIRRVVGYASAASAIATTKEYIDSCIDTGSWCVIFGHAWMTGQTDSAVLDEILTYIDTKIQAGLIEYQTVKYMVDNYSNIVELGNGANNADYFYLDKNGNVDFSIQGVPLSRYLKTLPVYESLAFSNKELTSYRKNSITIEPILYGEAIKIGLPDAGIIITIRYNNPAISTLEIFEAQLYIQNSLGDLWGRQWRLQKGTYCWYPYVPLKSVACTTTTRPRYASVGTACFDTTIGKAMWCKTAGVYPNKVWAANTPMVKGDVMGNFLCIKGGTTGAVTPTWDTNAQQTEGTVTWLYIGGMSVWVDAMGTVV